MIRRIGKAALWALAVPVILLLILWLLALMREQDEAVPPTTTMVETPLGEVAATSTGPADGTPILLVHGTAAWSGFWRDIAAHLAAQGWRVIAVDLPPFGYSEHDPKARYDRTSQAARLATLLRKTAGGRPAVVLGHSFGAGAATELALREPGLVRQLVLVDAALGVPDAEPSGAGLLGWAPVAQPVVAASITNPWAIGPLTRSFISRKEAAAPWLETLRQPMRRRGTTAAYAAWLPALFVTNDGSLSHRSAELARIRPPVALIWGETDTVTPIADGEALAKLLRVRRFVRLPGVGHIPHIEAPREFIAALDGVLIR